MLSLDQLRKIDVEDQLSDQELLELRDTLCPIIEKILDKCFGEEEGPSAPNDLHK